MMTILEIDAKGFRVAVIGHGHDAVIELDASLPRETAIALAMLIVAKAREARRETHR